MAVLLPVVLPVGGVGAASSKPRAAGYIVVYRGSVADVGRKTTALQRANGFRSDFRYAHALKGFAAHLSSQQVERLRGNPDVAFVTPDRPVQAVGTAPLITNDSIPTGVLRTGAATPTTVHRASTVGVAVIDTGIAIHPDLKVPGGKTCVSTPTAQDDNGHGTHVAGTVGAKNNGSGVVGIAPHTKLYAVKVLNSSGSGSWSQVICGIDWVTQMTTTLNIKVANMSLAGPGFAFDRCGNPQDSDALHKAICNSTAKGVLYVAAAGNSAKDLSTTVPAAYPEVLTVTAMSDSDGAPGGTGGAPTCRTAESDDSYASFSNFVSPGDSGGISHMIAGPGVCIRSTWLGWSFAKASGTSMAAPHVTGIAALCIGSIGTGGVSTPGPCTDSATSQPLPPAQIIERLRSDAAAHATAGNGFTGDPGHAVAGRYFGNLAWAGGY